MKKTLTTIWLILMVAIVNGQSDIPFERNIDLKNHDIKNVNLLNNINANKLKDSTQIENIIDKTVNFDPTTEVPDTANIFRVDLSKNNLKYIFNNVINNSEIYLQNPSGTYKIVTFYLRYTGQPTINFVPPSGYNIVYRYGKKYTGPTQPDVMDKIVVEIYDNNTILIYPSATNFPNGEI